jgi:Family of unknown function (DUF6399)
MRSFLGLDHGVGHLVSIMTEKMHDSLPIGIEPRELPGHPEPSTSHMGGALVEEVALGTVVQYEPWGNTDRRLRWARLRRAALLAQYGTLQAQGVSQRHAAKALDVPRTTLQAWRAWQEQLDAWPRVVEFVESVPGLAFRHRLVLARQVVCVELGACGMRLGCLFLAMTGRNRCVGASFGTQQQGNRHVAEALVAYRHEETARLTRAMPPQAITVTQEETFTGGLGLVGIEPVSNSMLLEQTAQARDHATWRALREAALAPLKCPGIQSTSDEAPGLLAYVAHHLGVHHSPDLFQAQHELSKAVAVPMAATQRAAEKAMAAAAETLRRVHQHTPSASAPPERRGPGRPPKAVPCPEQAMQEGEVARQACQRLAQAREQIRQSIRASGHAYHFVALDRGVRRNGKLIAHDIQPQSDTIRTIAQHEGLSAVCRARIEKAERVVPKMPATIACVSGYGRQHVRQLDLRQPESYAVHAHLIPSYSLERVAATRPRREGQPVREWAERMWTPLFASGGALSAVHPVEQERLKQQAATLADVFQRSSANVEGRNGYLSLRNHALCGLDRPRKRVCLTTVHNFLLTRPDGTTAAERFFGQKPRSMFTAILEAVEIPPAPRSPPRRVVG